MSELRVDNLFDIKGKVALVSGGGSGIGNMIASTFVANGMKVFIAARKESQLKEAAEELNKSGPGSCEYIVADLSSKAGVDALVAAFKSRSKTLDVLVNNSGATWGAPFNSFPEKEGWDRVLNLNVKALFYMTSGLSDLLASGASPENPGRVINISSVASVNAHAEESSLADKGNGLWSYNTSKAAVNHLTTTLAVTLAPKRITVNAICPGFFPSKMTAFGLKTGGEGKFVASQPLGRIPSARDVGGLATFLVSPAGAHVTGAHILLDGGQTLVGGRFSPATRL